MSSLIAKFQKAPYGYRTLDIRNMVALLLVNEKVKAKLADQLQNIHSQNFMWEFSRGSQDDRFVIEVQTEVDPQTLMKVKRIMKDAFDVTIELKEATLRDESLAFFTAKGEALRRITYRESGMYPGKALVEEMLSKFSTITSSSDSETVFKKIINLENSLMIYGEKIDSIINFYNESGSQMKTWKSALEICKYYEDNSLLIPELGALSGLIGDMDKILTMDEPFNMIAKLGQYVQEANEIRNTLLDTAASKAKETINKNLDSITKEYNEASVQTYNKQETLQKIQNLFESEKTLFENLVMMLTDFDKIASATQKSGTEVLAFRTALAGIIANDIDRETPPIKEVRKTRVYASNLIPVANRKIKSREDIEHLLNNIKDNLEDLLDSNDEIEID